MRRGRYTGDRTKELKFRSSPRLYETVKSLSQMQDTTLAAVLRRLITESLERMNIGVDDHIPRNSR